MNYEALKLDNQLCFALYACSREITKLYKPFLDKLRYNLYSIYFSISIMGKR